MRTNWLSYPGAACFGGIGAIIGAISDHAWSGYGVTILLVLGVRFYIASLRD